MGRESGFDWIVIGPAGAPDARLPIAGSRAGAIGVLNLEFATDEDAALRALATLVASGRGRCGVLVDGSSPLLAAILSRHSEQSRRGSRGGRRPEQLADLVASIHGAGLRAFLVATSLAEAEAGETAGFDAVIAKGDEAGGWVGDESTFILLQQCAARLRTPVWAYGGVGLHTAAACAVAGAAGAVLDSQLLLARETPLPGGGQGGDPGHGRQRDGLPRARARARESGSTHARRWRRSARSGNSRPSSSSRTETVPSCGARGATRSRARRLAGSRRRRLLTVGQDARVRGGSREAVLDRRRDPGRARRRDRRADPQREPRQPARGGRRARAVARHALPDRRRGR